jgi:ABC-type lipoprotein export system ATPase subunit
MAGHLKGIPPAIRFDNVFKTYLSNGASVHALNGVSLEAHAGEFVALMGRSGCGKSTLLNLAGAMDQPTQGRVFVEGQDTASLDDAGLTRLRRSRVGFVFQSFQLLQNLSAVENVELPLLLARAPDARRRAIEQLARVELAGMEDRLPHQLSGGQMQRVAIARALVHSPKILLADEPTGNLDTATGDVVLRLLREIAASGVLVLMATHSAESAELCDRVIHMRDGRIEA